jgi:hypothetical protein
MAALIRSDDNGLVYKQVLAARAVARRPIGLSSGSLATVTFYSGARSAAGFQAASRSLERCTLL